MGLDRRRDLRLLQLERGSAIIEGAVGLAIGFILLALLVHVGMLMTARASAQSAVAAAARRAAHSLVPAGEEALVATIEASVPGADRIMTSIDFGDGRVTASVSFRWTPPGPSFGTTTLSVTSSAPLAVPP